MLRKYLLAGMALAFVAGTILSIPTAARAHDDDDNNNRLRYYIVRAADGLCRVRLSQRYEVVGRYKSMAAALRGLAVKRTVGEC
jgi:hypothetical protein